MGTHPRVGVRDLRSPDRIACPLEGSIGWVLLVAGVGTAVQEFAQEYAQYGLYHAPGAVPGADVAAWITEWIWIPYMASVALLIPMLYPTGRLPSSRWQIPLVIGLIAAGIGALCFALTPGDLGGFPGVPNPVGPDGMPWIKTLGDSAMFAFVGGVLAAIVSMAVRYRRSEGDERQQLKWLLLAISLLALSFIVGVPYWTLGGTGGSLNVVEHVLVAALVAIPAAIGVAILKFHLYDIDVVIKKTVVYAVLAVLLFAIGLPVAWAIGGLDRPGGRWTRCLRLPREGHRDRSGGIQVRRVATRIADRLVFGRRATRTRCSASSPAASPRPMPPTTCWNGWPRSGELSEPTPRRYGSVSATASDPRRAGPPTSR